MYLFLVDDSSKHKKPKDRNKNVAIVSHNEYKDASLKRKCLRHSMNRIQSKNHRVRTCEINIILIFGLNKTAFFVFCFSRYKAVDIEYSLDNYESLKISIGAIMKNPEMQRFFLNHLKTKKMCKNVVKKLFFVIRYVLDQYEIQEMYDKVIPENGGMLKFVDDCCKNQKMCNKPFNKAAEPYPSATQFVPECCKTQEICDKAVDTCPFVADQYKTQEMRDKAVSKDPFMSNFTLIDTNIKI